MDCRGGHDGCKPRSPLSKEKQRPPRRAKFPILENVFVSLWLMSQHAHGATTFSVSHPLVTKQREDTAKME